MTQQKDNQSYIAKYVWILIVESAEIDEENNEDGFNIHSIKQQIFGN